MATELTLWTSEEEPLYTDRVAAKLARISLDLLRWCERDGLIRPRTMPGGGRGYTEADIHQLARIRRLREHLGLDPEAVDVVLHLRRQVIDLLTQLDELERQMLQREQELLNEIQQLRRQLAVDAGWR